MEVGGDGAQHGKDHLGLAGTESIEPPSFLQTRTQNSEIGSEPFDSNPIPFQELLIQPL